MDADHRKIKITLVFDQLRVLRESLNELQAMEEERAIALRGQQTVDSADAVHLSFLKLQDGLATMEEVLATIAEATGEIPKL